MYVSNVDTFHQLNNMSVSGNELGVKNFMNVKKSIKQQ